MIEAHNISIAGHTRPRLDGVDCRAGHGEFLVVLGANGAGKSTLLQVLAGDLRPTQGGVDFLGRPLAEWPLNALARHRAVLTHTDARLAWTVEQLVALGRLPHAGTRDAAHDRHCVDSALDRAGISALRSRPYPRLSAGEQGRVQFARCLAQIGTRADALLLLDEPVAHADLKHQHALLGAAQHYSAGGGVVIAVLHDLNQAMHYATSVLLLKAGRCVASGTPHDVLTEDVLEAVYDIPIRRVRGSAGVDFLGVLPSVAAPFPPTLSTGV